MTGIERLREFTEARPSLLTCDQIEELRDISAQIAHEHAEDCHRMGLDYGAVLGVVADMERHFPCVERGEESDVGRWARELRGALGGRAHGPADDVSVSAYDLLSKDERDAIAWVRKHGGIAYVRDAWDVRSNLDRQLETAKAKVERQQRHIEHVQGVCKTRAHRIVELNKAIAEMRPRLMPEGMEWPRFEDGEPVRIGDEVTVTVHDEDGDFDRMLAIRSIKYKEDGVLLEGTKNEMVILCHSERVKRPAPKVLDADGAEIREKRDAWWICEGDERGVHAERLRVEAICPNGLIECSPYNGGTWVHLKPSELYVNEPVPASDGRPLREGDKPYRLDNSKQVEVRRVDPDYGEECVFVGVDGTALGYWLRPGQLTHERPDTRAQVIAGIDKETVERIDRLVRDGRWLDD